MKKTLKLGILILTVVVLLSSCGLNKGYQYEQKLNCPDDNYRTWYELFVYSYYDSDGDGVGDIKGATQKLDKIADMGFNGIWLMPINPSTTYHKYDVTDYYDIDPQYGTIEDFKEFLSECDKRGIKVIMDLVLNHTSSKHSWFQTAIDALKKGDTDNKYIGYYNFVNGEKPAGKYYPTGAKNWYYEAMFWDQMPDLNLENEDLKSELTNIMKYWLDMGVHGFRLDAAKEFYSGNTSKNIEVCKWINDTCKSMKPDSYLVGEVWDNTQGLYEYYSSGIDSFFNFPFAQQEGKIAKTLIYNGKSNSAQAFASEVEKVGKRINENSPNGIDANFFTNHDTPRAAGFLRQKPELIKTAWAMNIFMTGNVFVYYGEEIGMSGSGKDENKRAPMYWSQTNKTGIAYGPPNMDMDKVKSQFTSYEEQEKDKDSILNYIKRAIRIRNENPEIARGISTSLLQNADDEVCVIKKSTQDSSLILVYNLAPEQTTLNLKNIEYNYNGIRGYLSADNSKVKLSKDGVLTLPPYSIVIIK